MKISGRPYVEGCRYTAGEHETPASPGSHQATGPWLPGKPPTGVAAPAPLSPVPSPLTLRLHFRSLRFGTATADGKSGKR
ncbi:hypothetical protein EKD02_02525 [Chlorobium phaeovibrioides]|uniref:Uncharacterized protein n=1 Tax=Chlorobium phaeovibrioides TaxID=1094 RepID=A0A3S0NK54_CHLPH|nr:hypothetical protein [Chlorobium phaeovibrioides]RTY39568.1 hypothetical protein EKD02_02525 [Chlorobium phaeovibrioides]